MRFLQAHIEGFGKIEDLTLDFGDGLNVITGENEAGKSTLHAFLRAMLFGMERGRGRAAHRDAFTRFKPWNRPEVYGGSLLFTDGTCRYLLHRSFSEGTTDLRNVTTGQVLSPERDLPVLLQGLTPSLYDNTLSIGQLMSETDPSLLSAFQSRLGSLRDAGSAGLDAAAAQKKLKARRKELEKALHPVRPADAEKLEAEIDRLAVSDEEDRSRDEAAQLAAMKEELAEKTERRSRLSENMARCGEVLSHSNFSGYAEAADYLTRLENAWKTRRSHMPYASETLSSRTLSTLSDLAFYAMLGVFLIAELAFFKKNYPTFFIYIALAGVCYLVSKFLENRRDNAATYEAAEDYLSRAFEEMTGDGEVSAENYEFIHNKLETAVLLYGREDEIRTELSALTDRIIDLQSRIGGARDREEARARAAWAEEEKARRREELLRQLAVTKEQLSENAAREEEIRALDLALATFAQISEQLHGRFGGPLSDAASSVLAAVTDGTYDRMLCDQNGELSVRVGPDVIPVSSLSRGTVEQLYLSLRIGAASLLWPDGDLPLILDESFAFYDPERLRGALTYLTRVYPGQVLLLTCQGREADIAVRHGLRHTLIRL